MDNIKNVKLGSQGLVVPPIGLGCMGMTEVMGMTMYGQAPRSRRFAIGVLRSKQCLTTDTLYKSAPAKGTHIGFAKAGVKE
ncbi:MAG: hypothetical protein PHO94_11490 [Petrimonas sp.]|nr:hypothetical protein [Petrimonas sp.]